MSLRLALASGCLGFSFAACQLPAFEPLGYVATPGPVTCVSQSSLQVGQACGVTCEPNSTAVFGGSTLFACGSGDVLVAPTLKCEPSCTIPPFSPGVIGSSSSSASPCSPGVLCRSCTCDVACDVNNNFTSGVGSSSYVCTSSGLLRGGTLRCFPCVLPSSFDIPHLVQSNVSDACYPGDDLPNNTKCDLFCDANYVQTGNNSYFCDSGATLRAPNMTCLPQPCTVPSIAFPYVSVSCNSTLAPGANCSVQCDSRHSPAGGDPLFYCDSLVPTPPSLRCVPNNCTALLPSNRSYAFDPDLDNACSMGDMLVSNSSCRIACALGFEAASGSDSLTCLAGEINSSLMCMAASCAFFSMLAPGHVPLNCALGGAGSNATLRHGSSCRVGCAPGYTGSEQLFTCAFGQVNGLSTFCVPNSCILPVSFFTGMIGDSNGTHSSSCTPGGTLASSSACDVMCDNLTYTQSGGPASYACNLGVLTAQLVAQCVPFGGCAFPSIACLQSQTCMGGDGQLCSGAALATNTSCGLTCVSTFTANMSAAANITCLNGTLTIPDNFCFPTSCTVNLTSLGILGEVTGCRDGETLAHNQSCSLGCNSSLQLVVGTQSGSKVTCLYGTASVQPLAISNQFCRLPACTLPLSLPLSFAFQPNGTAGGCVPGSRLENYPSDSSCSVRCDQGYEGSATYTCSKNSLTLNGDCMVQDCSYTVTSLPGVVHGNSTECDETACALGSGVYYLTNGSCCDYECDVGYHLAPGASLRLRCPSIPTNCGNFSTCTTSPSLDQVKCEANTCIVPSLNGSVGVGSLPCVAGMSLRGDGTNSTCEVGCPPGYEASGATTFSCSLGSLTNATLVCSPLTCTVPALPFQQEGDLAGVHSLACTPGLVLQSGQSCDVRCEAVVGAAGTSSFSCLLGNLTSATLICLQQGACLLPKTFSTGAFSAGPAPCPYGLGQYLEDGKNCSVECKGGFNVSSIESSMYSCVNGSLTPPDLTCTPKPCNVAFLEPLIPSARGDRCNTSQGLNSGQNCSLTCNSSYVSKILILSCVEGSTVVDGVCEEASCSLPALLPYAITSGVVNGCNQSGVLTSGSQCSVQCAAGYFLVSGTSEYSCAQGVLTTPNLTCSPLSCSKTFGPNEVPDNSTGQGCGSTLESGSVCYSKCAPGFEGESGYASRCYLGNLSTGEEAGPTCTPSGCVLPPYPHAAVMSASVSGCFPGDTLPSNASCSWTCNPSAFYDLLGSSVFTCDKGVFIASASLTCLPFACTLPPLGPNIVGVAAGSTPACNASELLAHGKSCGVGCGSLSLAGSSVYSCNAGILSAPSAVCYNKTTQCLLNLVSTVVGEAEGDIFACGRLLNGGSSCRVGCASGYVPNTGTRIYTCSANGVLTVSASLQCLGAFCPVPDLSAQGVIPVSSCAPAAPTDPGCAFGYSLANGSSDVEGSVAGRGGGELVLSCAMCAGLCASLTSCVSYQCSPSLLKCSLFAVSSPSISSVLSDFVYCEKTGPACGFGYHSVVGDVIGSGKIGAHGGNESVLHCGVCAGYCTSQSSCQSYECSPSLRRCNLNSISSPNGPAQPSFSLCVKDVVPAPVPTGFLASGSSCSVQCSASYLSTTFPLNQSSLMSCLGGRLSYPNVRCVPKPCVYPSQFPSGFGALPTGASNRCVPGGVVAVGSSCRVACAPYFYPVSGSGTASCSVGPSLSTPNLTCSPFLCSAPATHVGYQVSGCFQNSSQAQCAVTCTAGFSSVFPNGTSAGPIVATCPVNGGIFKFSGCVEMQQCSIPPVTTGYSLSCSGAVLFLASDCTVSCATSFTGSAALSCPASGVISLTGCSSCACAKGTGRNGSCTSACTTCPSQTFNDGSSANCTACRPGTCVNQNQTGCSGCTISDAAVTVSEEGTSGGSIAAAILVPLIIIGLCVAGFFLWKRQKTHGKLWTGNPFQRKKTPASEASNSAPSTEMA